MNNSNLYSGYRYPAKLFLKWVVLLFGSNPHRVQTLFLFLFKSSMMFILNVMI